jgi:hypothetical protein
VEIRVARVSDPAVVVRVIVVAPVLAGVRTGLAVWVVLKVADQDARRVKDALRVVVKVAVEMIVVAELVQGILFLIRL